MIIRPAPRRPTVAAVRFRYRQVVDAGNAQPHQAMLVEFPVLVAVAAAPVAAVIMPLVSEAHADAVFAICPQLLDQPVIELPRPLARQKGFNGAAALEKFRAVALAAIDCIGERHPRRVA